MITAHEIADALKQASEVDKLAGRRIAQAAIAALCPFCGQSLAGHGGSYAGPPVPVEAVMPDEEPPTNWRALPPPT